MVVIMSDKMIFIRDTRNGQSALMKRSMLKHPAFRDFFEEVRTDKPVPTVLHAPRKAVKEEDEVQTEPVDKKKSKWGDK